MTFSQSVEWLLATQLFGIKLGLDNMAQLAAGLGHPEKDLRFVHVAGTNGKGSTCAFAESIARASGMRTGLYTSPHLVDVRERFQTNRRPISPGDFARHATRLRELVDGSEVQPTYFELTTALALMHFREMSVDLVIWETGMGGRLDATNIVSPVVSVITPIALDHTRWLGSTVAQIAGEKAGIIKPRCPVVTCWQHPDVMTVLESVAEERPAPLIVAPPVSPDCPLGLPGEHQRTNAGLAAAAMQNVPSIDANAVERGLATAFWPGRFQRLGWFLLDGAHNPHAIGTVVQEWRRRFGSRKTTIVFGALSDKAIPEMLTVLASIALRIIAVPVRSERTATLPELMSRIALTVPEAGLMGETTVEAGLRRAEEVCDMECPILVTGSLFLVGEALQILGWSPDAAEAPAK